MILRHVLLAWARNLQATRLVSAIAILGLAIGLAAALIMALLARGPLGFNAFLPDADRIHVGVSILAGQGMPPNHSDTTMTGAAPLIDANMPEVEAIARATDADFRIGQGETAEKVKGYWADPAFFEVLRFRALAGDPVRALARPDGLVLTQSEARRLLGAGATPGARLIVDGRPFTLGAIVADPPRDRTDIRQGLFVSGLAATSPFVATVEADPNAFSIDTRTFLRLAPGTDPAAAERRVAQAIRSLVPQAFRTNYRMELVSIRDIALDEGLHPQARERLTVSGLVAGLILFVAAANFVNLSVALGGRRRREIGVRKACGASRGQLAAQFLGEAMLSVLLATLIAAAAAELLLPPVAAFLQVEARFDYLAEPALLGWLLLAALVVGLLAGAWPAVVLSALEPVATLRQAPAGGRGILRNLLVTAQFAVLIGLLVATAVVWQQRAFASGAAVRASFDRVVAVEAACPRAFVGEVARLPGVESVACSGEELLTGQAFSFLEWRGTQVTAGLVRTLPAMFDVYGVRPVAGSLAALPPDGEDKPVHAVLNESAVRRFGLGTPAQAIGRSIPVPGAAPGVKPQIVAVVPDFAFYSVTRAIQPTLYVNSRDAEPGLVSIRLAATRMAETLAAIDRLWRATGQSGPIRRAFVSDKVAEQYRDLERGILMFAVFAGIAAVLACLGLVGLAIAAAERRTKEIGIRKALGARTGQILTLLLGQLARPVLWANVIAWPLAWWGLRDWLNGFAYRVDLDWRLFPAAGLIALALALIATAAQAARAARARPVTALRYE